MAIDKELRELWAKYEDVAIHFNDLIMRLRTHALTGIAGVVTVAGLAINFSGKSAPVAEWTMVLFAIGFLTIAWFALWILDVFYYNKLLEGAVQALRELETATQKGQDDKTLKAVDDSIILSTRIFARAGNHLIPINIFYSLVFVALLVGVLVAFLKMSTVVPQPSSNHLELKMDRVPNEKLRLSIDPATGSPSKPSTSGSSDNSPVPAKTSTTPSGASTSGPGDPAQKIASTGNTSNATPTDASTKKSIRIYLAGPLFTQGEWQWNDRLADELKKRSIDVILPQRDAEPMLQGKEKFDPDSLFKTNLDHVDKATAVVAILDGADADSGTSWECGYAFKFGIPIVGVRTDIRGGGDDADTATNLMLAKSCVKFVKVPLEMRTDIGWVADRIVDALGQIVP